MGGEEVAETRGEDEVALDFNVLQRERLAAHQERSLPLQVHGSEAPSFHLSSLLFSSSLLFFFIPSPH